MNVHERVKGGSGLDASGHRERLDLRSGEWVQVRSEAEILATLTREGKLDSLPFMPEMLKYCGQKLLVSKRADKTCDTISSSSTGLRRMRNAVHLADARCSGDAHDGCQAGCLLFWKEAWLERADGAQSVRTSGAATSDVGARTNAEPSRKANCTCTREMLTGTAWSMNECGDRIYTCQATELLRATSGLSWWHVAQYVRDVRFGNATLVQFVRAGFIGVFNKIQVLLRRFVPTRFLIQDGLKYPFIQGRLTKTPKELLDLQPGDLVEVKSKEEIVATLDTNSRNRGLLFDREMVSHCGRRARVLRRVNRIVDERTGRMLELTSDSLVLEGMYCRGDFNRFCPRSIYAFWREIWLKRVPDRPMASYGPSGSDQDQCMARCGAHDVREHPAMRDAGLLTR